MGFEPLAARVRRSLRLAGVRASGVTRTQVLAAGGLTGRERELVALVELGLTNVEIARRLGLGRPTVARILASAMTKLGVSSRAQLAAIAPD
jgi:DNA-binding CsgD family transcriptional regulator